ncbi:UPF0481 protein At3g47200 [Mercurialis annua]|uniref:UPF0481 protein At3g47200 n=1 Tax=Mercurialis annua TaxID=3986 RepID=UPI00215EF717|nr:UPF0481 protein At3g47200 [Mercurialis annua]
MRGCYADSFEFCSTTFANMILLDSVFIIELFMRHHKGSENLKDFILGKPWLSTDVQQDLLLLENQLPFSILEHLYNFARPNFAYDSPSFLELTCNYFSNFKPKINAKISNPEKILHFTDLVRQFWIFNPPLMGNGTIGSVYSITKLHQAGLKLKPAENKCFLEISFERGVPCVPRAECCKMESFFLEISFERGVPCVPRAELQIPRFEVDDTTEFVVRNLMALEQCHYPFDTYICNCIRLWDLLIDTAEDVELLVEKKILVNGLGDGAAVANLVNKLCNQIAEVRSCYSTLSEDLNAYYENCGNHTMAILRSVYFGDLWRGTGTIAAVVLLILTAIQAICFVLQL